MDFIINDMGEFYLELDKKFFENWFPKTQGNEINVWGQVIKLKAATQNTFLFILNIDHNILKELYIRPPYQAIHHTLYGLRSDTM